MAEVLQIWLDSLISTAHRPRNMRGFAPLAAQPAWPNATQLAMRLPPGVKGIDCAPGICAILKCTHTDRFCLIAQAQAHGVQG